MFSNLSKIETRTGASSPSLEPNADEGGANEKDSGSGDNRWEGGAECLRGYEGQDYLNQGTNHDGAKPSTVGIWTGARLFAKAGVSERREGCLRNWQKGEGDARHGNEAGSDPVTFEEANAENLDDGHETGYDESRGDEICLGVGIEIEIARAWSRENSWDGDDSADHGQGVLKAHDDTDENREVVI